MSTVIRTFDLTRKFGDKYAVNKVNLELNKGQVYGFIGMNGAGKSTCIRMITGLLRPTSGKIEIFGESTPEKLREARKRIGGYVDAPTFYGNMSAHNNLEISKRLLGNKNKQSIEEILKLVCLEDVGKKPVKNFSMGMRQRLAIGRALLNDPEIIILDEPINGLDPSGIQEIRELIKNLSKNKGITLLISSHILSELQKVATNYGIIRKGRLIEQISASELSQKLKQYIFITSTEMEKVVYVLEKEMKITEYKETDDGIMIFHSFNRFEEISKTLKTTGTSINSISCETETLESYFMNIAGGDQGE